MRQTLGFVSNRYYSGNDNEIYLTNWGAGADGRAGLAYHFRPGGMLFAEWHYRQTATIDRWAIVPGRDSISSSQIPWSKFAVTGSLLRVGVGWY